MRKVYMFMLSVCLMLTLIGPSTLYAEERKMETEERNEIDVDELFPCFSQEDFDNHFNNYADRKSSKSLNSADKTKYSTGSSNVSNVVGIVLDQNTELSICGAKVKVIDSYTGNIITSITTDCNGRFQIKGLNDGIYNWVIEKDGYGQATYLGYDVCRGDITSIFTFYVSQEHSIERKSHIDDSDDNLNPMVDGKLTNLDLSQMEKNIMVSSSSFSSAPTLKKFTVGVNGTAKEVNRYSYLCYVVASEALGYYQCKGYGMTDSQIKNYYSAQAVAANTFLEYAASVHSKHSKYTVCNTACCQTYDTTKTTEFVISGVAAICYKIAGDWHSYIQVYKSGSSYSYIQGLYFAHCAGKTKEYGTQDLSLKSVACTDIGGSHTSLSGHGYGLCQEGAAYKAKKGSSWSSILSYYYNSTSSLMCPHAK